jgi:hypothetical protein
LCHRTRSSYLVRRHDLGRDQGAVGRDYDIRRHYDIIWRDPGPSRDADVVGRDHYIIWRDPCPSRDADVRRRNDHVCRHGAHVVLWRSDHVYGRDGQLWWRNQDDGGWADHRGRDNVIGIDDTGFAAATCCCDHLAGKRRDDPK